MNNNQENRFQTFFFKKTQKYCTVSNNNERRTAQVVFWYALGRTAVDCTLCVKWIDPGEEIKERLCMQLSDIYFYSRIVRIFPTRTETIIGHTTHFPCLNFFFARNRVRMLIFSLHAASSHEKNTSFTV